MIVKITHNAAEGTLLSGTTKGDGAIDAIRGAGLGRSWRWGRSIGLWYVPHSRDRAPQLSLIAATTDALRVAGFTTVVEVDATPRPMEDAEGDRAGRMDDRAEALHAAADRKQAEADGRAQAADQISDGIPLGQPILVGHHSERRHRRDLERIDRHTHASIDLGREAARARHGAETAELHMAVREDAGVATRRVERLAAERRRVQRALDGHTDRRSVYRSHIPPASGLHREQLEARAAHLDEQLRYWRRHLTDLEASGVHAPVRVEDIRPGDLVRGPSGWERVVKVKKKTVCVEREPGWNNKVPLSAIREHRQRDAAEPHSG